MKLEHQKTPSDIVWREFSVQKKKAILIWAKFGHNSLNAL